MKKNDLSTEKRLFLAVALSFVVLLIYPYIMKKILPPPPVSTAVEKSSGESENQQTTEKTDSIEKATSKAVDNSKLSPVEVAPTIVSTPKEINIFKEEVVTVNTPLYKAEISTRGGGVRSFELKSYKKEKDNGEEVVNIVAPVQIRSTEKSPIETTISMSGFVETTPFTANKTKINISGSDTSSLTLTSSMANGLVVTKTYIFSGDHYFIDTETVLTNNSGARVRGTLETGLVRAIDTEADPYFHKGALYFSDEETERLDAGDGEESGQGDVSWIGVEDKYFLLAMVPTKESYVDRWTVYSNDEETAGAIVSSLFDINSGGRESYKLTTFIGPKEFNRLKEKNIGLEEAIEFGFLSFIAKPVLSSLNYFYGYLGNYGFAIILLTIIIKIIFHPLTKYSFQSMKKMQSVQPQMKTLREKYKNDKQKMNMELMELYKRYKINPLGGCLPMLLQIPVFIALYEALSVAIELRHAPFIFWIQDLSAADPYYISPLLMGASMFIQQRMTPSTLDPIQQKVMLAMPIVFTFVFLSFPSGLVIYWLINNCITIAQMYHVHKED